MGLGNNSSSIFLSVNKGKIVRRFKEPTPNSKERTLTKGKNTGKVVHEESYDFIIGYITSIEPRSAEWGKTWNVTVNDGTTEYILQLEYSSGYTAAFLKALPNVNFELPVKLSPKLATDDKGKERGTIFINQKKTGAKWEPVKWFYTKENPNGIPGLEKILVKGKETWDDSKMMLFLEAMVNSTIIPRIAAATGASHAPASTAHLNDHQKNEVDNLDESSLNAPEADDNIVLDQDPNNDDLPF